MLMSRRAKRQRTLHFCLLILWCLLGIPTLLWWNQSVLWVALMSLYANIAGHWSAFEAATPDKEGD